MYISINRNFYTLTTQHPKLILLAFKSEFPEYYEQMSVDGIATYNEFFIPIKRTSIEAMFQDYIAAVDFSRKYFIRKNKKILYILIIKKNIAPKRLY